MIRRQDSKPSAADISRHEEEVALWLATQLEEDLRAQIKNLRKSDQLCLLLGQAYVLLQRTAREDGPQSDTFAKEAGAISFLLGAIDRQLAIENGSASA